MIALILAATLGFGHAPYGAGAYGKTYVNTAGNTVRRPILSDEMPTGATGRCLDRYWTFAEKRAGACQGHGGVWVWLKP